MKTLAFLRHAKSDWGAPGLNDLDRPLNPRGRDAARRVGRELKRRDLRFDLILASPAERVRQTLAEAGEELGESLEAQFDRRIYLAEPETLIALVRNVPDDVGSLLLVGHNPGTEQAVRAITEDDSNGFRTKAAAKYPTGAMAIIDLPVDRWADVGAEKGRISALILPRELSDQG